MDCLAGGGGLLLVLDEVRVGRTVDGAVHAVRGQGGQVVLLLGPAGGASASRGEDHQRFGAEVSKGCGVLRGGAGVDVLVDGAAKVAGGGAVGADLVVGLRRQAVGGEESVQSGQSEP